MDDLTLVKRTLNGVAVSLNWPKGILRVGSDSKKIPKVYSEEVAKEFLVQIVPSLRSYEIPAALKVFHKSRKDNFWILLMEQMPRSLSVVEM